MSNRIDEIFLLEAERDKWIAEEAVRVKTDALRNLANPRIPYFDLLRDIKNPQVTAASRWRRAQQSIAPSIRAELLTLPCMYCGDSAAEIDHIIPISRGGTKIRENLAPACERCNHEKLDFTPEEWKEWRRERGYEWPPPVMGFAYYANAVRDSMQREADRQRVTVEEFAARLEAELQEQERHAGREAV